MKDDTVCSLEMVTIISKILHSRQQLGVTLGEKTLRMEFNTPKDLKDKIENTFEKPQKPKNLDDEIMEDVEDWNNRFAGE